MLKKSFLLLSLISFNIAPTFASEEQQEEARSFFPLHFSAEALNELITEKETQEDYKIFSVTEEDSAILFKYSPSRVQVITGGSFPQRVKRIEEDLETHTAVYEIRPAYSYVFSPVKMKVQGEYDVLRSFLPHTEFSANSLCLHRLRELGDQFSDQTSHEFRLNPILARLFYVYKVLETPKDQQATFHALNKDNYKNLGHIYLADYMKDKAFSQETRIKVIDQEEVSLPKEFYQETFAYLKSKIYATLGVDEQMLESMYEGEGLFEIMAKYNTAMQIAGEKSCNNQ